MLLILTGSGYICGYQLPAGNGYGYGFIPVAGNGYGFRYVMKVAGTGNQRCYPWIVYLLLLRCERDK
jgi:hypothetical protein